MKQPISSFRCIVYQEKDDSFTGVCLDLDIVEGGHSTLQEAVLSINDAVQSHLQAAERLGNPEELLFRPAPKEYWDKMDSLTKPQSKQVDPTLFQLYNLFSSTPSTMHV